MKILVTGAAGFIGFHLCKRLMKTGYDVAGLDNINSYYDVNLKYSRLKELGEFNFYKADLTDLPKLREIFEKERFDIVCNLAAQAGVRYSFENPSAYIQSNVVGFANIMELSRIYAIKHFIYASSSSIYGNNNKIPFSEDDRTDNPQSLYAATKKENELIAHVYSRQWNMATTGLRFFTVYGPWGRPDMAPFLFMRSILEGKKIRIFNNGNLSRDFSYIDDIIEGVVKIIESVPERGCCKVYNIGNSSPVELMEFIKTIETVTGKEAVKEFVPMQQGDVYTTYADTSKLARDFGFRPNTPLEKGIREFYNWYCEFYKIGKQ